MNEKYTPDQEMIDEEAAYLTDFYLAAIEQKPRLTVHCHHDGTDEALCQAFFQTKIPNVFLLRFFGRLLLLLKAMMYFIEIHPLRDFFSRDEMIRSEAFDYLIAYRYGIYAFGYMTEAEAEIQSNLEAHLSYYEPYYGLHYHAPEPMTYPPLTEDEYRGWGSFFAQLFDFK